VALRDVVSVFINVIMLACSYTSRSLRSESLMSLFPLIINLPGNVQDYGKGVLSGKFCHSWTVSGENSASRPPIPYLTPTHVASGAIYIISAQNCGGASLSGVRPVESTFKI
jgi:hypothetical protein